jgi:hypothetical protein
MSDDDVVASRARWQFKPDARFALCEGDDDKGLLDTIAALPNMPDLQVRYASECNEKRAGGRSGFEHAIREFPIVTNFRLIKGFVFVTDNDNNQAFKETCQNLSKTGYTPPANPDGIGELDGRPVKILLIPSAVHGDLEKLCLDVLISKWPKSKDCVEAFLRCTGADGWNSQASKNKALSRATIVGFSEADPYKGLGHLFRSGDLSVTHPKLEWLVESFRKIDALLGIA